MTDFNDQTSPEYQAAYDDAMKRLEAGEKPAEPVKADTAETAPTTSEAEQKEATPDDRIAELELKLARQEKALKDTQRAMHQKAQEVAELKRAKEAEARAAAKPKILQEVPELEDAVRYVSGAPSAQMSPQQMDQIWMQQVQGAIPKVEELLGNKDFEAAALARRDELGPEAWRDPIVAIRELGALRERFVAEKAVADAKAEYAKRSKDMSAMKVAGGSGRDPATSDRVNGKTAADFMTMSSKDFDAERRRVLGGYSF